MKRPGSAGLMGEAGAYPRSGKGVGACSSSGRLLPRLSWQAQPVQQKAAVGLVRSSGLAAECTTSTLLVPCLLCACPACAAGCTAARWCGGLP